MNFELFTIPLLIKKIPPKGYHIFVDGKVMSRKIRFLIDTGASKSVIDSGFAMKYFGQLRIKQTDHQTTGLGTNLQNSEFIKLQRLKIGERSIRPTYFALLDLSMINDAYTSAHLNPVIAIIGGDILNRYDAVIDYGKSILTVR